MKTCKKILFIIFLFFTIFCVKSFAYEMDFGDTPSEVSPGETFTVQLSVSENTYLANGHITFDSSLFTYVGAEQENMVATLYSDGDVSWMYTEISSNPTGETSFEFKFQAKKVTKTSSGDFTVTGVDDEGVKFITTDDYTYWETEVGGSKTTTVTIYVEDTTSDELEVSTNELTLAVGETQTITANKTVTYESLNTSIATVDENGNVTGVSAGTTCIKVTDEDGNYVYVFVTVETTATLTNTDDTTSNTAIPQTGLHENAKKIIIVAVFIVFVLVVLRIVKKYKNWKKLFVILPLIGVLSIPTIADAFTNVNTTKIKAGIFSTLNGVSNVVTVSPNDSFKYGTSLTQDDVADEDGIFQQNNLEVSYVTDSSGNTITSETAIGTGYKIYAYELGEEDDLTAYSIVLYGDADGNATFCDDDDIDVIRNDYVYNKSATGLYYTAANLYAYDDILDVSDIQRMILKRYDKLDNLNGKDGTDGSDDSTLVNPFPTEESDLTISNNKITLNVDETEKIKVSGGTGTLTYDSRSTSVATVSPDGTVTGVSKGNTIIDVTDSEGNTATVYVIVNNPATGISIEPTEETLNEGDTLDLSIEITPENAENTDVEWSSSNETVATVDPNGKVTALEAGEATITVTIEGTQISAECKIIVIEPLTATNNESTLYVARSSSPGQHTIALRYTYGGSADDITWSLDGVGQITTINTDTNTYVKVIYSSTTGTKTVTATAGNTTVTWTIEVVDATVDDEITIGSGDTLSTRTISNYVTTTPSANWSTGYSEDDSDLLIDNQNGSWTAADVTENTTTTMTLTFTYETVTITRTLTVNILANNWGLSTDSTNWTYYEYIEEAVEAAGNNTATIKPMKDLDITIDSQIEISSTQNITLDLNGKTITSEGEGFVVNGDLTLDDSTSLSTSPTSGSWDFKITNAIELGATAGSSITSNGGTWSADNCLIYGTGTGYTEETGSTVVISGGSLSINSPGSDAEEIKCINLTGAALTLNGGTVTSTAGPETADISDSACIFMEHGYFYMNGGTVTPGSGQTAAVAMVNTASVEINGGSIRPSYAGTYGLYVVAAGSKVTINGGSIYGCVFGVYYSDASGATLKITGESETSIGYSTMGTSSYPEFGSVYVRGQASGYEDDDGEYHYTGFSTLTIGDVSSDECIENITFEGDVYSAYCILRSQPININAYAAAYNSSMEYDSDGNEKNIWSFTKYTEDARFHWLINYIGN